MDAPGQSPMSSQMGRNAQRSPGTGYSGGTLGTGSAGDGTASGVPMGYGGGGGHRGTTWGTAGRTSSDGSFHGSVPIASRLIPGILGGSRSSALHAGAGAGGGTAGLRMPAGAMPLPPAAGAPGRVAASTALAGTGTAVPTAGHHQAAIGPDMYALHRQGLNSGGGERMLGPAGVEAGSTGAGARAGASAPAPAPSRGGGGGQERRREDRLARNRASARESRRRKKMYLETLEERVRVLSVEVDRLRLLHVQHMPAELDR